MDTTVSVIIPVYNHAHRVCAAIQSVFSQTFQDFELIIVDDGSTDQLEEVLQEFDNLKIIHHEYNKGRAAARNTGVVAATGKYIAFLDADDEWKPRKLEKQMNYFTNNPDKSICLTGYELVPAKGQRRDVYLPKVSSWEKYFAKYIGFPDGTIPLILRECFEVVGLQDTSFIWHENWEWLLRASKKYQIGIINEILVVRRMSKRRPPAFLKESAVICFINKHKGTFAKYGVYGKSAIALKWFDLASVFFHERKWSQGIGYFVKGWKTWPFQSVGLYVRLFDSIVGTNIELFITSLRAKSDAMKRYVIIKNKEY